MGASSSGSTYARETRSRPAVALVFERRPYGCGAGRSGCLQRIMFAPQADQKPVKARQRALRAGPSSSSAICVTGAPASRWRSRPVRDARPFLWHNYHSSDPNHKFITDLRYTSYLAIGGELSQGNTNEEETEIFKNMETPRRYNVREARKAGRMFGPAAMPESSSGSTVS